MIRELLERDQMDLGWRIATVAVDGLMHHRVRGYEEH
jgi:hypothetical protein